MACDRVPDLLDVALRIGHKSGVRGRGKTPAILGLGTEFIEEFGSSGGPGPPANSSQALETTRFLRSDSRAFGVSCPVHRLVHNRVRTTPDRSDEPGVNHSGAARAIGRGVDGCSVHSPALCTGTTGSDTGPSGVTSRRGRRSSHRRACSVPAPARAAALTSRSAFARIGSSPPRRPTPRPTSASVGLGVPLVARRPAIRRRITDRRRDGRHDGTGP